MSNDSTPFSGDLSRRQFLAAAGAAAILPALSMAQAPAPAGPKIKLGLIGCGGRGTWIAKLFQKHGGYEIYAGADYFQDRVDAFGKQLGVPADRLFTGLSAYKKLLDLKEVDAVAVISPPYFHPEQIMAAIDAGKHAYCAKPIAVDIPGTLLVAEAGKKATASKRVMLVDFQTRATDHFQEALKRVHAGALGDIAYGNAFYHTGRLGAKGEDKTPEGRLRNWVFDVKLSGDIIVEQNIHTLDVMNWVFQEPPLQCTGTGGRKGRVDVGDCWDHYACLFEYPGNVGVTFSSRQYDAEGLDDGIIVNVYGSKGVLLTNYGGLTMIRGKGDSFYRGGKNPDIYESGAVNNIATFHKAITGEVCDNPTVPLGVQSNQIAILGRTCTRKKKTVTWQEMLTEAEKLEADLSGLKA